MTLPILAIVLFGLFEFSLLFTARGELSEATRAGARKATMPGVTFESVEEEIRRVLSPRLQETMEVSINQGQRSGDVVTVAVACDMSSASPDLLWPIGYSLKNRKLYEVTKMIREQQFPAFKKRRGFRGRLLEAFVTREARLVFTHKGNPGIITSS